jgi:glycosyltransferase involved in cell wall biosynthesis
MRILLLGENVAPGFGGGHTFTDDVFQGLQERSANCAHQFFLLDSSNGNPGRRPSGAFPVIRVNPMEGPKASSFGARRVYRAIRRRVSGSDGQGKLQRQDRYRSALLAELTRNRVDCALSLVPWEWSPILPNILTVWDLEHRRKSVFPELGSNGEWEKREERYRARLPRALTVITGTELGKSQIEHFYGVDPEVVKIIPFPTPTFALESAGRSAATLQQLPDDISGEFLFYPAQFWPHKNHVRLLQAVKILRDEHAWEGTLVCVGSDQGNIEYIKKSAMCLGIQDKIKILGFVERDQLVTLYRHALALTFLSYLGPDNLPPLEAFALSCPVIASAIEGARESLGEGALYVNPDSAEDIVAAVLRLKNERGLRERMVAAGHLRARQWTVKDYVDQLIELIDHLEVRFQCFRGLADPVG